MAGKIYMISDTHFDHENIIKYCNRPFGNKDEMNKELLKNWQNEVCKEDLVFFLGDLTFSRDSLGFDYWKAKLSSFSNVVFIRGYHDKTKDETLFDNLIINYKGYQFMLIHNPEDKPKWYNGWVICGHHHNHYPDKYPLINKTSKTINVSVELIKYKPIQLNTLIELIN